MDAKGKNLVLDIIDCCLDEKARNRQFRAVLNENTLPEEVEAFFNWKAGELSIWDVLNLVFIDYETGGYHKELSAFLANGFFKGSRIRTLFGMFECRDCYKAPLALQVLGTYREEWVTKKRFEETDACPACAALAENLEESEEEAPIQEFVSVDENMVMIGFIIREKDGEEDLCPSCLETESQHVAACQVLEWIAKDGIEETYKDDEVLQAFLAHAAENFPEDRCFAYYNALSFPDFCNFLIKQPGHVVEEVIGGILFGEGEEVYLYCRHRELFDMYLRHEPVNGMLALQLLLQGTLPEDYVRRYWIDLDYLDLYIRERGLEQMWKDFVFCVENTDKEDRVRWHLEPRRSLDFLLDAFRDAGLETPPEAEKLKEILS
jgi:hypothetical protein